MSWSSCIDSRLTGQKNEDYFRGYEMVEVSFSKVFEKGNVTAADRKDLSTACGTNKRLRTCFQLSQHGKSAGIRGHPLEW